MQDEEEDWETVELPDFIKILEEKRIAERKLIEEDDNRITNDLFKPIVDTSIIKETIKGPETINIKRPKKPTPFIKHGAAATANALTKARKEIIKRRIEIFGEAETDEYEERYGYIADI